MEPTKEEAALCFAHGTVARSRAANHKRWAPWALHGIFGLAFALFASPNAAFACMRPPPLVAVISDVIPHYRLKCAGAIADKIEQVIAGQEVLLSHKLLTYNDNSVGCSGIAASTKVPGVGLGRCTAVVRRHILDQHGTQIADLDDVLTVASQNMRKSGVIKP